jgi:hypothetical protein
MTIAIGAICKGGIIMGSDSRTTNPDFSIRDDAKKVRLIRLLGPDNALISQSGDDALGSRILTSFGLSAAQTALNDWRAACDIADNAITEEQRILRKPFEGPGFSMEEYQGVLRGFDASFMLAHYYNGTPYLFKADFYPGRFSPIKSHHAAIGCGASIADMLLDGFDFSELTPDKAMAVLVYVIEEVKRYDPRCGGSTRIALSWILPGAVMASRPGQPVVLSAECSQEQIALYANEIPAIREAFKREWKAQFQRVTRVLRSKWVEEQCRPERFVRLRFGEAVAVALTSLTAHINESGNDEANKLVSDFKRELEKTANRQVLRALWEKLSQSLPSVTQLPYVSVEIQKLF